MKMLRVLKYCLLKNKTTTAGLLSCIRKPDRLSESLGICLEEKFSEYQSDDCNLPKLTPATKDRDRIMGIVKLR